MTTIRENFVTGAVQENPLSAVALQLTMAGRLQALPTVVAPNIARLSIDPDGTDVLVGSGREIVHVTAYVQGDPLATIVRGQEGTTPKPHSQGVKIVHADTVSDWTEKADLAGAAFTGPVSAPVLNVAAGAGAVVFGARVTGDAFNRAQFTADGVLSLGSGLAAPDTPLYRAAANQARLDGSLLVAPTGLGTPGVQIIPPVGGSAVLLRGYDTSGTTKVFEAQTSGQVFASGTSSYFGPYAMGGTAVGPRARILASSASIGLIGEGDATTPDVNILYRLKGSGTHRFQDDTATAQLTIDKLGAILMNGSIGWPALATDLTLSRQSAGRLFVTGTVQIQNADSGGAPLSFVTLALQAAAAQTGVLLAARDSGGSNVGTLDATGIFRLFPAGGGTKSVELQGSTGQVFASGTSSYFGPNAMGGVGTRLRIFPAGDVALIAESDPGTLDVGFVYRSKGAGLHKFQGPAASTTAQVDGVSGQLKAVAVDHYFGPNAFGAAGSRLRLHGDSGTYAAIYAEGSTTSVDLYAAAKGAAGNLFLQTNGFSRLIVWNDGSVFAGPGAGGTGKRTRFAWDGTFSYIDGDDQAGSTVNGNMYLRSGSIYMQIANSAGEIRIFNNLGAWIGGMNIGGGFNGASTTHTFGPNAVGSTGSALRVNAADANNVYLAPVSSAIGAHLHLRPYGGNTLYLEDGSGNVGLDVVPRAGASGSTQLQIYYNNAGTWESHNVAVNTAVSPRTLIVT